MARRTEMTKWTIYLINKDIGGQAGRYAGVFPGTLTVEAARYVKTEKGTLTLLGEKDQQVGFFPSGTYYGILKDGVKVRGSDGRA
jgi:hypothetical protein